MRLPRNARWAVPAVAVVVIGGAIAASAISVAQAAPDLPAKTPAQLLASIASTQEIPPLTGTVVETADLGLPQLPDVGNSNSLTSLITGSHTIKVYWLDAKHFRLALPQAMTETDVIRNGSTMWLWESASNTVAKYSLAGQQAQEGKPASLPALTPQQAASDVLQAVGATTVVGVDSTVSVAGEAAYTLRLAPKDSRSTIGSVAIAIDGKTNVPLRVQVFAKGSATPAFQVGYTQISYVAPAAANFDFTPPPGATYDNTTSPQPGRQDMVPAPAGTTGTYGSGWLTVAEIPQSSLSGAPGGPGSSAAPSGSSSGAFGADSQAAISAFLGAGKQVSGSWGSGQLIHTSLINVLIVGDELYVGAVQPSVLEAAVGHVTPAGNGS
jgi:outer membrane lipoprotein-sorting protein